MQNKGPNEFTHSPGSGPGTPVAQFNLNPAQRDSREPVRSYNLQYLKSDRNSSVQTVNSVRPLTGSLLSADDSQMMQPAYATQDDVRTPEVQRSYTAGSIKRVPAYDDQGQASRPETVTDERHRLMPFGPPTTGPTAGSRMIVEPPGYGPPDSQPNTTLSPTIGSIRDSVAMDRLGQGHSEVTEQRLSITPAFVNGSANDQGGNVLLDMSTPKKTLNLQDIDPNSVLGTIEITQNIIVKCLPGDGKMNALVPSQIAEPKLRQPSEVRFSSAQPLESTPVYANHPSHPSYVETLSNFSDHRTRTIADRTMDMTGSRSDQQKKKKKCCLCCVKKKKKPRSDRDITFTRSDGERSQAIHTEGYDGFMDSLDSAKLEAQLLSENAPPPDSAKSGCCKRKKKQKSRTSGLESRSSPTSQQNYDGQMYPRSIRSEIPLVQHQPCLPVEVCSQLNTLMAATAFEDNGMQEGQGPASNPGSASSTGANQQPCPCMHQPFYFMPYFFVPSPNGYGQASSGFYYCPNGPPSVYPYGNSLNNQPHSSQFYSQSSQKHPRAWCC
ncbi:unnamed protein product [Calicophoron daubneyi]|uniref:Period n=1 Tax=Calicophoron daubneyi TaxID=300641 RepID=A0AAV2TG29_CALDB